MQEIDRRRLSFKAAEAGEVKPGQDRIGPTMRQMIAIWRREMDAATERVSAWIS